MMVITKDALDRFKASQRLGAEAAAAVEADITALLRGKWYEHLVQLQKQIQAKLARGEPIDGEYSSGEGVMVIGILFRLLRHVQRWHYGTDSSPVYWFPSFILQMCIT